MTGSELERRRPGHEHIPVVRRAQDMARAAQEVRARRHLAYLELAEQLPQGEQDEVTVLIFHRVFRDPYAPAIDKRYTYIAHWRWEPRRWYISQDPNHRHLRPMDNRELVLFARPVGRPILLTHNHGEVPVPVVRVATWFLPTEAAR